ncbi:hypothetical protein Agub_g12305, partial [Astrephomene gubernaculifera]
MAAAVGRRAFCFDGTTPPTSHHLRNYPSVREHSEWYASHIDELLRQGLVEAYDSKQHGPLRNFAATINPLHVVSKADGNLRPIIDPTASGVNDCMTKLPCPLPDLASILEHLPFQGALGKRDLASGFHHIKCSPEARRYMAFRHPTTEAVLRWVVLPFGASQSPPIFVELTNAACAIFQAECDRRGLRVKLFCFVDDYIILGVTHADVVGAFAVMDEIGGELGLEWKTSKDRGRNEHLRQLDFLGMLFDTEKMEMRISPDKRQRYAADVRALLDAAATGPVQRHLLESTVGRLTFIAR